MICSNRLPYKGNTSGVLTDVVAGHLDLSFIQFSAVHQLEQSGKLRVLAVCTDKRMEVLPNVPTMAEAGFPDIVSETWNAISAPPKTPAAVIIKLNQAINAACRNATCWRACAICKCRWAAATSRRRENSSSSSGRSGAK